MRASIFALVAGAALGLAACSDGGPSGPNTVTTLEAVSPAAGATGIDPASPIAVRFSGAMGIGMERYVDLHQGDVGGPVVPMACTWSNDRATLTCTPGTHLASGTGYALHVGSGMMDANNRPVDVEGHGTQMGGHRVTGQMMGGMHAGQATGLMGPGWRHAGDAHMGMAFAFETGPSAS
ncbi:MAG TPA: Ig-like domain-containing protein [Gemmatimonadales bacterium]|nr:Ig-like domain-containing protein [Gemmatimonadales bacterium]